MRSFGRTVSVTSETFPRLAVRAVVPGTDTGESSGGGQPYRGVGGGGGVYLFSWQCVEMCPGYRGPSDEIGKDDRAFVSPNLPDAITMAFAAMSRDDERVCSPANC